MIGAGVRSSHSTAVEVSVRADFDENVIQLRIKKSSLTNQRFVPLRERLNPFTS